MSQTAIPTYTIKALQREPQVQRSYCTNEFRHVLENERRSVWLEIWEISDLGGEVLRGQIRERSLFHSMYILKLSEYLFQEGQ